MLKDIAIGLCVALAMLAFAVLILWLLISSSETNRRDCESAALRNGAHATCVVVVR
ncbi:hypothetical protein [Streptomyces sp. NPDC049881]|uniref:hypothetical protein n=1 Tax=unclassified Streptomyces TaxID=2593676 RepID=UPI00343D87C3